MANAWFRMYSDMPDKPKIGTLSDSAFRTWTELLCHACRHENGSTGLTVATLNWALRRNADVTLHELLQAELVVTDARGIIAIRKWEERQFKSDSSADRVRKYRENKKIKQCNDDVTLHVTKSNALDTDTDTDKDKEQKQDQELPTSSGVPPPEIPPPTPEPDPIFGHGLAFLRSKGVPDRGARSFLGSMRKQVGDLLTAELLAIAEREDVSDPIPWLRKSAEGRSRGPPINATKPNVAENFRGKIYVGTPIDRLPAELRDPGL